MRIDYRKIDWRAVNEIGKDFIPAFTRFRCGFILLTISMLVATVIVTFMIMPQHFLAGLVRVKICATAKSTCYRKDIKK